jgi:hypothetical protein
MIGDSPFPDEYKKALTEKGIEELTQTKLTKDYL